MTLYHTCSTCQKIRCTSGLVPVGIVMQFSVASVNGGFELLTSLPLLLKHRPQDIQRRG